MRMKILLAAAAAAILSTASAFEATAQHAKSSKAASYVVVAKDAASGAPAAGSPAMGTATATATFMDVDPEENPPDAIHDPRVPEAYATASTAGDQSVAQQRVNNLANVEAFLNIVVNSVEIMGLANGIPIFLLGFVLLRLPDRRKFAWLCMVGGICVSLVGLVTPGFINWVFADLRDANLFS